MTTTQGIKLDDETSARLKVLAGARSRTPHWIMRVAINDYLDREEKYEREKSEDMARWENYLLTGKSIEHGKVEAWLKDLSSEKTSKCPR